MTCDNTTCWLRPAPHTSRPSLHARLRSLTLLLWPCALRQHARSRRMRSGPRCHAVALARSPAYAAGAPAVRAPAYPLRLYALHPLSYLTRSGRRCRCGRSKIRSTVRAPAVRAPAVRTLAVRAPNPLRPCALRPLMPLLSLWLPLWPSGRMRSGSTRGRTNNNKGGDLHREGQDCDQKKVEMGY